MYISLYIFSYTLFVWCLGISYNLISGIPAGRLSRWRGYIVLFNTLLKSCVLWDRGIFLKKQRCFNSGFYLSTAFSYICDIPFRNCFGLRLILCFCFMDFVCVKYIYYICIILVLYCSWWTLLFNSYFAEVCEVGQLSSCLDI